MTFPPTGDNNETPGSQTPGETPAGPPAPPAPPAPQFTDPSNVPPPPQGPQKTNTLAIVSLISSFFISVLGIILGHIALNQIKKTGEGGRGLALAGTIIGYVFTFFGIIAAIIIIASGILFASQINTLSEGPEVQPESSSEELYGDEDDDVYSDESDDDFVYDGPWLGTEYAPFCQSFMSQDYDLGDEIEYFQNLADTAPNSDLSAKYEAMVEHFKSEDLTEEAADDLYNLFDESFDEAWDFCHAL